MPLGHFRLQDQIATYDLGGLGTLERSADVTCVSFFLSRQLTLLSFNYEIKRRL